MNYEIIIVYLDNKNLTVQLDEVELPKFMDCVKQNIEYWNVNKDQSIYCPKDQIRYITTQKHTPTVDKAIEQPLNDEIKDI